MTTSTLRRTASCEVPNDAAGILAEARSQRAAADAAEARLLELGVAWVLAHPADADWEAATVYVRGVDTELELAGEGTPHIREFAVAEFAAAVGLSTTAGKSLLGEAVEIAYRLPRLWRRVQTGDLPAWKARRVARETIGHRLSREAAAFVDAQVAPTAHRISPAQLDRTVAEAIGRHMPAEVERLAEESWDKRHATVHDQLVSFTGTMRVEAELDIADAVDLDTALAAGAAHLAALGSTESLDVRRAQTMGDLARAQLALDLNPAGDPATSSGGSADESGTSQPPGSRVRVKPRQAVLYVHLTQAESRAPDRIDPVARVERGNALVTVGQVKAWCAHPDTQVVIQPVIDLADCRPTGSPRVPPRLAEQVALRDHSCVFPWCARPARRCDTDHVIPTGSAGSVTCACNLAPLCRRHHRLKTHSPWTYVVLDPGTYMWTSPHGYQFLRDPDGTVDVSRDLPRPRPRGEPPPHQPQ